MMLSFVRRQPRDPHTPKGRRAYAIGDIHGRLDLLEQLLADIERDAAGRPPAESYLIFLGDLIDRGPCSRQVVERLRTLDSKAFTPIFLIGNHEEVLLRLIKGESGLLKSWLRFGGAECLESYGVHRREIARLPELQALEAIRRAIPDEHVQFLGSFIDTLRFGDYLFVHAGIRPGVELSVQSQQDLRWIRAPFLEDPSDHGFMVVHGHTISNAVDERSNRIGIDTGAYASGILTAVGLEGGQRWYLDTNAALAEQTGSLVD